MDKALLKQIKKGIEVEMEHTDDPKMALKIAMDHIKEDPKYYDKLTKAGLEECCSRGIQLHETANRLLISEGLNYHLQNKIDLNESIYRPQSTNFLALFEEARALYDAGGPDRDKCLKDNPDIIKLPSDVPFNKIDWVDLNNPAQIWVRRWFFAYAKETLSRIRGKFSGNIKTPDSELTMDYQSLSTEAKDEKTKLIEELIGAEGRLTRLKPEKVMEREALLAENLNKQLKFRAMPRQIYVI